MATKLKRLSITILPEWEEPLRILKQRQFYDKSQAELIRFLIQSGLKNTIVDFLNTDYTVH